jgi:hypothetical protein
MAKVTAPLLGFGASGAIAKTAVYAAWRGIQYGRRYVIPANPRSTAQQLTRNTFATLREMYKRTGTIGRAPWEAFARGRPFTGMNSFVGENLRLMRGQADMDDFLGSPGAGGGLAFPGMSLTAAGGSGAVTATLTAPTLPTGWSIVEAAGLAINQQAPDSIFLAQLVEDSDDTAPYELVFPGFAPAAPVVVSTWFVYEKPDGRLAYSVGITDAGTTEA